MKIVVSSVAGAPEDPGTWSNAPAHLIQVLRGLGVECIPVDSSCLSLIEKLAMASVNVARGYPWRAVSWFKAARRRRGAHVAEAAKRAGCDLIVCTGTLDAPIGQDIDYAIWLDNTLTLLQRSAVALPYSKTALEEIQRLEQIALQGARVVLPFSEHVRQSVIQDYGIPSDRVHAIGCGSGALSPFEGEKDFSQGHLLFVAKHLFSSKGGDLVLEAFPLIQAERPETRLVLVGNAEACRKAAGMDGVEVHGYVSRKTLNRLFHDAAMLVQPMLADPWGQVYLEAMKARTVVVSLGVAALPELTEGGRLGVLIDKPDARTLADAVLATYDRPQDDLDRMTREAQTRAVEHHSWEAVGSRAAKALGLERRRSQVAE